MAVLTLGFHLELLARLVTGTSLGAAIGYERDLHGRPAGLRTHTIVALASATFMIVSTQLVYFQHYAKDDLVELDCSRIAASVVSGIGFLAGGAILRTGLTVQGLTTGAGLWLVAAIGLAAGGGMYVESLAVTLIGMLTLTILRRFEDKDDRQRRWRVTVGLISRSAPVAPLIARARDLGARIAQEDWERDQSADRSRLILELRLPDTVGIDQLTDKFTSEDTISLRIESL